MPLDGLRSSVYRSFVTCDDPQGVVDCGMMRKSKSAGQKIEQKMENSRRKSKNSNSSASVDRKAENDGMICEGGLTGEFHSPSSSSFQLMEISRGAEKLNHMIDTWSKGMMSDGQPNGIAKDLLKGALDLQESLVMLGKLQETSHHMSHLKKSGSEKSDRGRSNGVETQRGYSNHYGDQIPVTEFQKPRRSADGSSRSSSEELKRVIRDSLVQQKLVVEDRGRSNGVETQRAYSNHYGDQISVTEFQKPRHSADGSSRSSTEELKRLIRDSLVNQKLVVEDTAFVEKPYTFFPQRHIDSCSDSPSTSSSQSSMFHTTSESTFASAATASKKAKTPSLIAKLMGIEDYPSRPFQTTLKKELEEGEKISNQQRPMFDMNMPKVRKPQTSAAENVDQEKRTLREVLETMRFKGLLKSNSFGENKPSFNHSDSSKRFAHDSPPIVLIRSLPVQTLGLEERVAPLVRGEEAFYTKNMLKKDELSPKTIQCKEGALKSDRMHRKTEAEESPSKRINLEGRARNHRLAAEKPEEKEAKTKEKASRKLKASDPAVHKPQRKDAIEKKGEKIQKVISVHRNSPEKDTAKAKNASKSQDQDKLTSAKARKHESGSNTTKNQIPRQPSTTTNTSSKRSTQTAVCSSTERKRSHFKKEKPVKEPILSKSATKSVGSEESLKRIDIDAQSDSFSITSSTDFADQLHNEEETDTCASHNGEHCSNSQSSVSDATPLSSKQETEAKTAEEAYEHALQISRDDKTFESRENLGDFLMNNPSFLSLAEDLFDLNPNGSTILHTSSMYDFGESGRRLVLDCANELIKCRSVQGSQTFNLPLLTCQGKSLRICTSMNKLVQEACSGIENLRSYSKFAGENVVADSLYAMLEGDIMCRGVVNGSWDSGWRNGFSRNEAEQVGDDIEDLILDELINEVFA